MARDDTEIVSALRTALAERVGNQRYELWFGANTRLDYDGQTLTIGVPNRFFVEWIRSSFRDPIERTCDVVLGRCPVIQFEVDAPLTDAPLTDATVPVMQAGGSPGTKRPSELGPRQAAPRVVTVDERPAAARSNGTARRKMATLSAFVQGPSNRLAYASAEAVARQPGHMTPLLIHGPTGVGKTHLLEGVFSAARKSPQKPTVVYLSAEQFTTYFLEALRGSGLPSFRRKYRSVELLILDDLQFLAGKRATVIELLYTVDTLLRDGRQLVLAADRTPQELAELGPELVTRLEGGMVCRIDPPDHATRLGILKQMARRLKVPLSPDVEQFVASRLTNHARELSGALCRLRATSEALQKPITVAMAEEALSDMIRHSGRAVRLEDIERAVCDLFGVEPATLHSAAKGRRASHPRMLAMWLARKHTRAALSEIGHFFGRRSHSTVISAQKRVDDWMADGTALELADTTWSVDNAIRQVERRLRAG